MRCGPTNWKKTYSDATSSSPHTGELLEVVRYQQAFIDKLEELFDGIDQPIVDMITRFRAEGDIPGSESRPKRYTIADTEPREDENGFHVTRIIYDRSNGSIATQERSWKETDLEVVPRMAYVDLLETDIRWEGEYSAQ